MLRSQLLSRQILQFCGRSQTPERRLWVVFCFQGWDVAQEYSVIAKWELLLQDLWARQHSQAVCLINRHKLVGKSNLLIGICLLSHRFPNFTHLENQIHRSQQSFDKLIRNNTSITAQTVDSRVVYL